MRVKHPYALDDDGPTPDGAVHWGGRRELSEVDADGTFYVPDDKARNFVERWPEADGYDPDELLLSNGAGGDSGEGSTEATDGSDSEDADVCTAELSAGGTCGRDLPCPYHTEADDG